MVRIIKILIETNLFIAFAAVAFLWANILFLHLDTACLYYLSFQVFFSTWFVYQISRWVYFKKGEYANTEELVVQWFEKHPKFNKMTIIISGTGAFVFTLLLKWKTIGILLFIGGISVLYPFPVLKPFGIPTKLRDFPYVKIFLIAVVWSTTSVILPAIESRLNLQARIDVFLLWLSQFVYIFFITLPFDINDAEVDKQTNMKTIASVLGAKASKIICLACGILYAFLILFLFMIENWRSISNIYLKESTIYFIWLLLILLQVFTIYQSEKVKKWVIKLVYDGSMILYFFILLFTVK